MNKFNGIEEQKLELFRNKLLLNDYNDFLEKLYNYKYIENINDIKLGRYIRWISLLNDELKLTSGGFCCSIILNEKETKIFCKNVMNETFCCIFDSSLVFQKFSKQEIIIRKIIIDINS
uniref:Uncharacterized protein n=1 Tax=viral metagenome TaxID=1070528 RepID=A0A6C0H628_9ZZZZ